MQTALSLLNLATGNNNSSDNADANGSNDQNQEGDGTNQEEDQGSSDSDSSDDDIEDVNERFSDEEIAWSKRYFGTDLYAKFFKVCSELKITDNVEQILEMRRPRKWELKIRNAKFSNLQDLNDYFLQFYVGYNLKQYKKRAPKSRTKKVDKQGQRVHRKYEWHTTGSMGQSFASPCLKNMQQGETRDFSGFNEKRTWEGSYFDLYEKNLRVELWQYERLVPNVLLTSFDIQLVDVAQGGRLRSFELKRERDVHVRRDKGQQFGRLQFVAIFQERTEFKVQLKNWRLSLEEHCIRQQARNLIPEEAESCSLPVVLKVQLLRGTRRSRNSRDIESFQIDVDYHKGQHVSLDIGYPLDQIIHYKGTADKLLTESLQCTLWLLVSKGVRQNLVEMATVRIPLKQVLVTGAVLGNMAYLPGRSLLKEREHTSRPGLPTKPHSREANRRHGASKSVSDSARDSQLSSHDTAAAVSNGEADVLSGRASDDMGDTGVATSVDGDPDSRILFCGQIEGNVDVSIFEDQTGSLTELWTWFRQSGELNPPEVFDYAPYNYSYIGFHVAGVRGLSMLSSRDEGLNLFVSLEWAGQVYRTDTVRDWNGEPIDYTIYFQVFCISTRPQVEDLVRHPYVSVFVWHESSSGHNDLIGETQFFLHNISGKHVSTRQTLGDHSRRQSNRGGPTRAVYRRPEATMCELSNCKKTKTRKVVIHTWRKSALYPLLPKQYVEREVRTRVFSASLPLRSTDLNHNASVKISAWFRGPVSKNGFVDFVNTDPTTSELTKYLTLPHADAATERRKNALCHCATAELGGLDATADSGSTGSSRTRPKCSTSYREQHLPAVQEDGSDDEGSSFARSAATTASRFDTTLGCRSLREYVDEVRKHLYRITRVKTVFDEQKPLGSLVVPDPPNQDRHALRPKFYGYMVCLDQEHVPRFMPTMLARVTPPRTFLVNQNSRRYTNLKSEEDQLGVSTDSKVREGASTNDSATSDRKGTSSSSASDGPNPRPDFSQACFELMRYVHAVEFCDGHDFDYRQDPRATNADISTGGTQSGALDEAQLRSERKFGIHAATPTFLLESKKGDVRDHALLLCNMFLGLNLDAYVVIGKVYCDNRLLENATEHAWVMTRENSNDCCGGREGGPTSANGINNAAVRFWEVTNCEIYELESRCMAVGPLGQALNGVSNTPNQSTSTSKAAHADVQPLPEPHDTDVSSERGESKLPEASSHDVNGGSNSNSTPRLFGQSGADRDVLRLLEEEEAADRSSERRVEKEQLFFTTSGLGDGKNCMSQEEVLRENKVLEQLARDDFSIKEQQGRSRLNASIQLSANYKAQMQTLQSKMAVLPYAEVYAVFNNKNFWVNMQWREENNVNVINRDPTRITFNMGLPGTENEWLPFVTPERGSGSIAPCYIPRSLSARLPLDQARELEERALAELVSGLENIRSVVNATTVLANEASPGMVKWAQDVLAAKFVLDNWWVDRHAHARQEWTGWRSARLEYLKQVTRLMEQRPANYSMRMQITKMNSADAVKVRQMIFGDGMSKEQYSASGSGTGADPSASPFTVNDYNNVTPFRFADQAFRQTPLTSLGSSDKVPISLHGTAKAREWDPFHTRTGREMFVVAAKVFPLFNGLVMTYAAILCVYPNISTDVDESGSAMLASQGTSQLQDTSAQNIDSSSSGLSPRRHEASI